MPDAALHAKRVRTCSAARARRGRASRHLLAQIVKQVPSTRTSASTPTTSSFNGRVGGWLVPPGLSHALSVSADFLRRLYEKAGSDNIFFMAGAIAFNILVAFVPFCLAVLGIAGTILRRQSTDASERFMSLLLSSLPSMGPEFRALIDTMVNGLLENSGSFLG